MKHLLSLNDYSKKEILDFIDLAQKIKKNYNKYSSKLKDKTLLMIFAKPSLRTHLSFDVGMHKLGGHSIFYNLEQSTLGKKESIKDFSEVVSRYVDLVMARLYEHKDMLELAKYSDVPVVSGLDNYEHPCQALGDLLTIKEKFGKFKGLKLTYLGDGNNNVTHSLMFACSKVGIDMTVSCPNKNEYLPNEGVIKKTKVKIVNDPLLAVKDSDILYTDTWMSYHIKESQKKRRINELRKYQINKKLFIINKKTLFMHCLPAGRGYEVTDDVIDSKRSIIYDQAENRMWVQMAILLKLLKKAD